MAEKRAPRVALNAQLLSLGESYRSAGISGYIFHLLRHLPAADVGLRYAAFTSEPAWTPPAGMEVHRTRWPGRHPLARIAWEQVVLPAQLKRLGADLCHGLAFVSPLAWAGPSVITLFDLSFLLFPERFRVYNRVYLRTFTRLAARRARRVIVISESTKRDAVQMLGIDAARVQVIYCGVEEDFRPLPAEEAAAYRRRRGLPERFILFLGTLEPRKNITGLVDAYALFRRMWPADKGEAPALVIAGARGWYYDEIYRRVEQNGLKDAVVFAGYVPADELSYLYNAALLFAYPSLYEGFGLPVLEAMACGVPVVASNRSALPEVVGGAGILVSPEEPAEMAEAFRRVLTEEGAREHWGRRGRERAGLFSWRKAAEETAGVYRDILERGGR